MDLFHHYRNILRFYLIASNKALANTYAFPFLEKVVLFFSIQQLQDLEDPRIYNYFYLLRFFLGRKAFVSNYKSAFILGKHYYTFDIRATFSAKDLFYPILFLVYELLPHINQEWFVASRWETNHGFSVLSLYDMSLFNERKSNLGLYSLADPLSYKFHFAGGSYASKRLLLKALKIRVYR